MIERLFGASSEQYHQAIYPKDVSDLTEVISYLKIGITDSLYSSPDFPLVLPSNPHSFTYYRFLKATQASSTHTKQSLVKLDVQLSDEIRKLRSSNFSLQASNAKSAVIIGSSQNNVASMPEEYSQLVSIKRDLERANKRIRDKQTEIERLEVQIQKQTAENPLIQELKAKENDLKTNEEHVQEELSEYSQECTNLTYENSTLENEIQLMERRLKSLQTRCELAVKRIGPIDDQSYAFSAVSDYTGFGIH